MVGTDGEKIIYTGQQQSDPQSYEILVIFDPSTQEFTVEQLDSNFIFNMEGHAAIGLDGSDDSSDENFSDPDPENPYDFRRFVVKTPKKPKPPKEQPKREEEERGFSLDARPVKSTPKPSPVKKAAAPKEPAAKKVAKPRKTPVKKATAPIKGLELPSQVQSRDSLGPVSLNEATKSSSNYAASKTSGTKEINGGPRSLKATTNANVESSESDADNESSEDEGGFGDGLIVEDMDGESSRGGIFGNRGNHLSIGGGPISLSAASQSPMALGGRRDESDSESEEEEEEEDDGRGVSSHPIYRPAVRQQEEEEESDADEDEDDRFKMPVPSPGAQDAQGDDDDGGFDLEQEMLDAFSEDDDEPTQAFDGAPISLSSLSRNRMEDESSSEEE